jgi:hypothetical protein
VSPFCCLLSALTACSLAALTACSHCLLSLPALTACPHCLLGSSAARGRSLSARADAEASSFFALGDATAGLLDATDDNKRQGAIAHAMRFFDDPSAGTAPGAAWHSVSSSDLGGGLHVYHHCGANMHSIKIVMQVRALRSALTICFLLSALTACSLAALTACSRCLLSLSALTACPHCLLSLPALAACTHCLLLLTPPHQFEYGADVLIACAREIDLVPHWNKFVPFACVCEEYDETSLRAAGKFWSPFPLPIVISRE